MHAERCWGQPGLTRYSRVDGMRSPCVLIACSSPSTSMHGASASRAGVIPGPCSGVDPGIDVLDALGSPGYCPEAKPHAAVATDRGGALETAQLSAPWKCDSGRLRVVVEIAAANAVDAFCS